MYSKRYRRSRVPFLRGTYSPLKFCHGKLNLSGDRVGRVVVGSVTTSIFFLLPPGGSGHRKPEGTIQLPFLTTGTTKNCTGWPQLHPRPVKERVHLIGCSNCGENETGLCPGRIRLSSQRIQQYQKDIEMFRTWRTNPRPSWCCAYSHIVPLLRSSGPPVWCGGRAK